MILKGETAFVTGGTGGIGQAICARCPETFMQFLPVIRESCDEAINVSTGGGLGMAIKGADQVGF